MPSSAGLKNLWAMQDRRCFWCGSEMLAPGKVRQQRSATRDHIFPNAIRKSHEPPTRDLRVWVAACYVCNHERGATPPPWRPGETPIEIVERFYAMVFAPLLVRARRLERRYRTTVFMPRIVVVQDIRDYPSAPPGVPVDADGFWFRRRLASGNHTMSAKPRKSRIISLKNWPHPGITTPVKMRRW